MSARVQGLDALDAGARNRTIWSWLPTTERAAYGTKAIGVLDRLGKLDKKDASDFPLVHYFLAYYWDKEGDRQESVRDALKRPVPAARLRLSLSIGMHRHPALGPTRNPKDGRAPYYLGNYLFDLQPEAACRSWEARGPRPEYFRRPSEISGLAYARVKNDVPPRRSTSWRGPWPRVRPTPSSISTGPDVGGRPGPRRNRLARLEKNNRVVETRDDALSREIQLLVLLGRYDRAIDLLSTHHFHVWEGGERSTGSSSKPIFSAARNFWTRAIFAAPSRISKRR